MTVSNIVGPVLVYLDRFLIATVIGATAVAYYVTPFEIVTRLLLLPWAFSGVLFPLIASTFVQSPERSARLFSRGMRLTYLTLFPFVLCAIAFAHEGLSLWVGESIASHSRAGPALACARRVHERFGAGAVRDHSGGGRPGSHGTDSPDRAATVLAGAVVDGASVGDRGRGDRVDAPRWTSIS